MSQKSFVCTHLYTVQGQVLLTLIILNGFKYCYLTLIVLFAHSQMVGKLGFMAYQSL